MHLLRWGRPQVIIRRRGTRIWLMGKLVARVLFAAFLVFGTYNPTGRSFYPWLRGDAPILWKELVTALLLVAYGIALPVTWRALRFGGIVLATSLATTAIWVLVEAHMIDISAADSPAWITLSIVSFVIGVGLCWMLFGRILDGQLRIRDITR